MRLIRCDRLILGMVNRANFTRYRRSLRPAWAMSLASRFVSDWFWSRCCAIATAKRSRRRTSANSPGGRPRRSARRRFRSPSPGLCCRISPACRCWWTWPRCARRRRAWAKTRRSSSRWCRWTWWSIIRCRWTSPGRRMRWPKISIWSSSATASGISFSNGACRLLTRSKSCRRASASCTR